MNLAQLTAYRETLFQKAHLLDWSIKTIKSDLTWCKLTPERLIYWQEKISAKQADLDLFCDEIHTINQQIESLIWKE